MKKTLLILAVVITLCQGCMYAVRYDGTYRGKVVDEDTREPIEGVVALGAWYKEQWSAAGTVSTFYDARETVTDKNGEFEIPGHGLRIMTNLSPMRILLFKAGYTYERGHWDSLDQGYTLGKKIKWEGKKPIIPLKKLTMEERKKQGTPSFPSEAYMNKKIPLFIKELNNEEVQFNRSPYPEN